MMGTSSDFQGLILGNRIVADKVNDRGNNTLFYSDGEGVLSQVHPAFISGPVLISTSTVVAGSPVSAVEIKTGIDDTYDKYMILYYGVHASNTGVRFQFQVSDDTGSTYGLSITSTFYDAAHRKNDAAFHLSYRNNGDLFESTSYQDLNLGMDGSGNWGTGSLAGVLNIFEPASTTLFKTFYSTCNHTGRDAGTVANRNAFVGGVINESDAIDAINLKFASGNIDEGTFKLYGVR